MQITISVTGISKTKEQLNAVRNVMQDLSREFESLGADLTQFYSDKPFVTQGGIFGQPWARLNAKYEVQKAKKYPGRNTLVRTRTMQQSFRYDAGSQLLRIYNTAPYFMKHQLGIGVPQRAIFVIDSTRKKFIQDRLQGLIGDRLNKIR